MTIEQDLIRGLERALQRVEHAAREGVSDVARQIESGAKAGLAQADPDAVATVHIVEEKDDVAVVVEADDAVFIEFGTKNNDPQPFMRPAIQQARAKAAVTFGRRKL